MIKFKLQVLTFMLIFYMVTQTVFSAEPNVIVIADFDKNSTSIDLSNNTSSNITVIPNLLNCTNVEQANATLNKKDCSPINVTLNFECTKVDFDFLIHTTIWQPKLCYEKSCNRPFEEPKWRVQGLRSSYVNGTRPIQCCSDRQLDLKDLNPLMKDIKENWFYETEANFVNETILEEWNFHGSCVQQNIGFKSIDLFKKALDLQNTLQYSKWLDEAKITPSNSHRYDLQFFNYTMFSKINKRFQLRCKTFDYEKKISIIDTMNVCLNKQTYEIIDCPVDFTSNCLEKVIYRKNLLEYKVSDEIKYRDMNYYVYSNHHRSYAPLVAAAAIPSALALPAAYYYFKRQNKNKYKYGGSNGFYPGNYGSGFNPGYTPWYSSTAFSHSFAPPAPNVNYGSPKNFGNLAGSSYYPSNIYSSSYNYPKYGNTYGNSYGSPYGNSYGGSYGSHAYPPPPYGSLSGNSYGPPPPYSSKPDNSYGKPKNFGNLNVPDLSPNAKPSYPSYPSNNPSYPSYPNSNPSYPSYSNNNPSSNPSYPSYPSNKPSYPSYPSNNNPSYPSYPKDPPPAYSSLDKNKPLNPTYPSYPTNNHASQPKPSAPSLSDLNKPSSSSSTYKQKNRVGSTPKSKSKNPFGGLFGKSRSRGRSRIG